MELDLDQFRDLFFSEAEEKIRAIRELTAQLETDPQNPEIIHNLFRAFHTLKGMSSTMGFLDISELAHQVEDVLDGLRASLSGETEPDHDAGKALAAAGFEAGTTAGGTVPVIEYLFLSLAGLEQLLQQQFAGKHGTEVPAPPETPDGKPAPPASRPTILPQYVRVNPLLLDHFLWWLGELFSIKNKWDEITLAWKKGGDPSIGMGNGKKLATDLEQDLWKLNRITSNLQHEIKTLRLLPLNVIFDRIPALARDLSRNKNVLIEVACRGGNIEIDRSLIEALQDPIVHLIRNCIDHGIESPDERSRLKKSPAGKLTISAERRRDWIHLQVEDDGRGIDPDMVREKAVARGILTRENAAALPDNEALFLITSPGFSSTEKVTTTSGRGVGMDIVLNAVKKLGGSLQIESQRGRCARFEMRIPISAVIVKLLALHTNGEVCAIPANRICRVLEADDLSSPEDSWIPVLPLARILGWEEPGSPGVAVIIDIGDEKAVTLTVDHIGSCQDALVRPLDPPVNQLPGLTGTFILPSGRVAFVIDPADLLRGFTPKTTL